MSHLDVEQTSPEWDELREGKITASRAGGILGLSPYNSRDDVMREMVREYHGAEKEFTGNVATHWGTYNEETAVKQLEIEQDCDVQKSGIWIHDDIAWLAASPDGITHHNNHGVVEVKCPYNRKLFKLADRPDYYAQVMVQMFCTNAVWGYFGVWTPDEFHSEEVKWDEEWWLENYPKLVEFYQEFSDVIGDEKACEQYLSDAESFRSDLEWHETALSYREAKAMMEHYKGVMDDAKQTLVVLAEGQKCRGAGVVVYPIKGRTTTDYRSALKDIDPDIDLKPYQKTGKESWGVKLS